MQEGTDMFKVKPMKITSCLTAQRYHYLNTTETTSTQMKKKKNCGLKNKSAVTDI